MVKSGIVKDSPTPRYEQVEAGTPALLALADGTTFSGVGFGALRDITNPVVGEVVFNTSMYGYQEILTDPSYAGQILTFTYPHIGNVGCNDQDVESDHFYAEGMIIRELSKRASNFRSQRSLESYLHNAGKLGIAGLDTRELVMHLRDKGAQMGAIACGDSIDKDTLVDIARAQGSMEGKDYVTAVSCKKVYRWNQLPWVQSSEFPLGGYPIVEESKLWNRPHVVALDCGIKQNILRLLLQSGFKVSVVPATATSAQILAEKPDALFLSNGPGDPATLGYIVKTTQELLGKFPIFGICLGHQILGQVFGGKTYKLKFGHRGGNHPVMNMNDRKVEITVQNHGFAVEPTSLPKKSGAVVSHINLNDGTVEGLEAKELKAFSVQYHPESSPGPHDAQYLFRKFFESVVHYA